jgi:hypothetical protein
MVRDDTEKVENKSKITYLLSEDEPYPLANYKG